MGQGDSQGFVKKGLEKEIIMSKLLSKIGMGEELSRNFLAILIVAFGGAIIYGLPYFRFDYYDVYLKTYHLTNTEMGVFGSVLVYSAWCRTCSAAWWPTVFPPERF